MPLTRTIGKIILMSFVFLWTIGTMCSGNAQPPDSVQFLKEEGWIGNMKNHLGIKISFDNGYETFQVITETNSISLYPNIASRMNLWLTYRFIRFNIGFAPDFLPGNGDEEIKGATRSQAYGISVYLRHWFQYLNYSTVTGYYLKNTNDYNPSWIPGDPYIQFPELKYKGFGGTTGYTLNPKLSLKSLTIQTERQLKSAGSFVGLLNYRYYIMDDQRELQPNESSQKSDNLEIGLGPGYYYTFVIKEGLFVSTGIMTSAFYLRTLLTSRYPSGNVETVQQDFGFRWDGIATFGYNGRTFFTGVFLNAMGMNYRQQNTTVMNYDTRIFYQVYVGMRIRAPKGLNGLFNKKGL